MNLTPNWAAHERRIQTGPIVRLSLEPDPERLYPEADWQRRRGVGGADAGGDVHGLRVGTGTGQEGRAVLHLHRRRDYGVRGPAAGSAWAGSSARKRLQLQTHQRPAKVPGVRRS